MIIFEKELRCLKLSARRNQYLGTVVMLDARSLNEVWLQQGHKLFEFFLGPRYRCSNCGADRPGPVDTTCSCTGHGFGSI